MRIVIVIHGYPLEDIDEHRSPKEIWVSRLRAANRVAETFSSDEVVTIISGGGDIGGETEAKHMEKFLWDKGEFPALEETEIVLEEQAETTYENIIESLGIAIDLEADVIVPVSDVDHTPRVLYNWYMETGPEGPLILVGSSYKTYTETDEEPLILEPGKLAPVIASFEKFWDIDAEHYGDLEDELFDLFQRYSKK